MYLLKVYALAFLKSQAGAIASAFVRVALAAAFAAWMAAGFPVQDLALSNVADYLELGVQAGAALVLANYFGPWETRYGRASKVDEDQ